ncbi:MAG TPA: hypothetical protein VI755_15340 [Anaerolineales bacterium]|nr:hypothetical protein [Anaerolineales bacterium]
MKLQSNPRQTNPRAFWQQLLILLGLDSIIVFFGALLLRDWGQLSNLYFWSSILLFIIAAIPIFSELGSSAKLAGRAVRKGEKVGPLLKEKQPIYERGAKTTYLFGLAGVLTFILSMLSIPLG